jgi:hypothetical protein
MPPIAFASERKQTYVCDERVFNPLVYRALPSRQRPNPFA